MQKYLWAAAALSVALSAGMFLYVKHAIEHPESILMRYGVAAMLSGLNINPLSDPKPPVDTVVAQVPPKTDRTTNALTAKPVVEDSIEPIQIETMPVIPSPTDEPPISKPELTDVYPTLIESVPSQEGPKPMPYADEEQTDEQGPAPKLSWRLHWYLNTVRDAVEAASDAVEDQCAGAREGFFSWVLSQVRAAASKCEAEECEMPTVSRLAQQIAAAIAGMSWEPTCESTPDCEPCEEDPAYHHDHQSCPFSGACPYSGHCVPAQTDDGVIGVATESSAGGHSGLVKVTSEPLEVLNAGRVTWMANKFPLCSFCPKPSTDTMEFRWTDAIRFPVLPIGPY